LHDVTILGHVENGVLFVAPLGSPAYPGPPATMSVAGVEFEIVSPLWVNVGLVDDLPTDHRYLGDIRAAYFAALGAQ
jgi:hypothetical protein